MFFCELLNLIFDHNWACFSNHRIRRNLIYVKFKSLYKYLANTHRLSFFSLLGCLFVADSLSHNELLSLSCVLLRMLCIYSLGCVYVYKHDHSPSTLFKVLTYISTGIQILFLQIYTFVTWLCSAA